MADKIRILVVEDDACAREVLQLLLTQEGYDVTSVSDGQEAWDLLRERTGAYDVVFSDYNMPHLDGLELLYLMRKNVRLKDIPFVLMSGETIGPFEIPLSKITAELGAIFVPKPYNAFEALIAHVLKNRERQKRV